ncbi:MAG: phosphoribosyltransferase [Phycisphaerales bacterium JB040]
MRAEVFEDRAEAGRLLGERVGRESASRGGLTDPLVLAIPRGGVEVGAALAGALGGGAELDVVLSRKLRAPGHEEFALGAVSETGEVWLNPDVEGRVSHAVIERERASRLEELVRRRRSVRAVRARARIEGRSVIVTDDGIATGSTMIAALRTVRSERPRELIVAVPVAPPERLEEIAALCDRVVCLESPAGFAAVGQYYRDFGQVGDERVLELMRAAAVGQR